MNAELLIDALAIVFVFVPITEDFDVGFLII